MKKLKAIQKTMEKTTVPVFTDVQVRIHNRRLNTYTPLVMEAKNIADYIDLLRKEGRDHVGQKNYKQFEHLPLVSFVDPLTMEEFVFDKKEDLPKEPFEIRGKSDFLIAKFI
jgi:hypothetical protein